MHHVSLRAWSVILAIGVFDVGGSVLQSPVEETYDRYTEVSDDARSCHISRLACTTSESRSDSLGCGCGLRRGVIGLIELGHGP